ncbi:DNA polymerase beta superfamily protein [Sinorhizobium medicae]|uniref:nucleotidyltransferase domain-containing protein n=1 Tax=Sinorhizobium medicae TaxID=110321 RepID=UPI001F179A5D|nr:nucleotidyltransferase domain-containing protein [Sinorhizobium medicae]
MQQNMMTLRAIPGEMNPSTVAEIDARLGGIGNGHSIAIPLAVESGSRAWGFPSPDSDYDCRFVFVRSPDQYLSPWQRPDVIETPIEGEFDVNGWELGKALKLMLKGNAVIIEWLVSPIIYCGDAGFRQEFLDLARSYASRELIARHYLHLGERQRMTYFGDGNSVPQKEIFYALRPAATLRWLRLNPDQALPPMHFPTLMEESAPSPDVRSVVSDLLARKAETRELGSSPLPVQIADFIDTEFAQARLSFEKGRVQMPAVAQREAEAFFRRTVLKFAPADLPD